MQKGSAGRIAAALLSCLLTLVLNGSSAVALDLGEWVPGLKLSPFLSERVEYESNVFQSHTNAQDDVIFKTIPGFVADYTFGPHSLSAGFRAEILNYVTLTDQDTTHYIAAGLLRLDFPRLLLTLREDFIRTSDPPGTELTGPVLSTTNILKPEGEFRITPRFSTGLSYTWMWVKYDDPSIGDLIDRNDHLVRGSVYWKFVPKADLGLTFDYGRTLFTISTDRNYTSYGVDLGLRGELTAKLSSSFRVGYVWQVPDQSDQPGFNGVTFGGDFTYRPTERTTITLTTDRSRQESTFATTPFYVTTNGTLNAQHQILPKLSVGASIGGGLNDYSTKQQEVNGQFDWRRDTFIGAGARVEYAIQPWLSVGLDYLYISRFSNFDEFSYVDNRISGRVTLQF